MRISQLNATVRTRNVGKRLIGLTDARADQRRPSMIATIHALHIRMFLNERGNRIGGTGRSVHCGQKSRSTVGSYRRILEPCLPKLGALNSCSDCDSKRICHSRMRGKYESPPPGSLWQWTSFPRPLAVHLHHWKFGYIDVPRHCLNNASLRWNHCRLAAPLFECCVPDELFELQ